jgi:hypothetical protein
MMPLCGSTIVASARQLAAVPLATQSARQGRSNSDGESFVEPPAQRVAVIGSIGGVGGSSACQTAGCTEAALVGHEMHGHISLAWGDQSV